MILINRDMPECCKYCPLCSHHPLNGNTWCNDKNRIIATNWNFEPLDTKPDWCELKEHPDNNVGNIGHWIFDQNDPDSNVYECSKCGEPYQLIEGTPVDNKYNYCPNCGKRLIYEP